MENCMARILVKIQPRFVHLRIRKRNIYVFFIHVYIAPRTFSFFFFFQRVIKWKNTRRRLSRNTLTYCLFSFPFKCHSFVFFCEKNFKEKYSKISSSLPFLSFFLLTCNIFFRGKESCATRNGRNNNDASMQTIAQGERNLETAVRTRVAINSPVFARLLCEIIGCCTWSLRRSELPWPAEYTGTQCTQEYTHMLKREEGSLIPTPESCNPTVPTILVNGTLIYFLFYFFPLLFPSITYASSSINDT